MIQDDGHIPNTVEKQIFDTLVKIRQRDSSIYDANKHFFVDSADTDKPAAAPQAKKPSKPMMLKDVIAQQVRTNAIHQAEDVGVTVLPACHCLLGAPIVKDFLHG